MIDADISRLRIVAMSFSNFGICPIFANSSSKHLTWTGTIKVTGKGKIAVKPDKIRLYVNKEELCKEYEDTLRRSTEDTELLKDLFEKLGFQRKDLKTVYFNVDTEYESY